MERFDFYRRWLLWIGLALVAFGVGLVAVSGTALFEPIQGLVNPAFWSDGGPGPGPEARQFMAWIYGAWGATVAGWGAVVAFLANYAFRRREAWAWRAVAIGTTLWFILDTAVSAAHGVTLNVIVNVALAVLVAVPLLGTRRAFMR